MTAGKPSVLAAYIAACHVFQKVKEQLLFSKKQSLIFKEKKSFSKNKVPFLISGFTVISFVSTHLLSHVNKNNGVAD